MNPASYPLRNQIITSPFRGYLIEESTPSGGVPVSPILESISVSFAVATVKLRAAYAGQCVRLRRSSDNAESDFEFTDLNILDINAISSWLGGANGFLVTWYDQSGSGGDNATQGTAGNQPQYRNSGIGNYPDFDFDSGSTHHLIFNSFGVLVSGSDKPLSFFTVRQVLNDSVTRVALSVGNSGDNVPLHYYGITPTDFRELRRAVGKTSDMVAGLDDGNPHVHSHLFSGTTGRAYVDNILIDGPDDMNVAAITLDVATLGALRRTSPVSPWDGPISLAIAEDSELSDADRTTIDGNAVSVYGI